MIEVCVLASGSSGNCIYIGTERAKILLDVGISGTRVAAGLRAIGVSPWELDGIIVTHEHRDHLQGVGIVARRFEVPVFATELTWQGIGNTIGELPGWQRRLVDKEAGLQLGDCRVEFFSTSHDAADPVGCTFATERRKVGVATDMGVAGPEVMAGLADADLLVFEANHDVEMLRAGRYPWPLKRRILGEKGHLSNETAARALAALITEVNRTDRRNQILLAHLSKENNRPELAMTAVTQALAARGVRVGLDATVSLTYRDRPAPLCRVG
ncbi:MAG: MBL fold metallo-hydrolase [Syntrophothermus sp.]